jgi:transcriptional accessory protein Tex/SPT6
LDLPGLGQKANDLTEEGNDWEDVLSNEQFLLTERDDLELPDLDDILDDLNKDREDLRAVIPPLLQSSGLLLSISLGAIYFILNDGTRMGIHFAWIIFFLFIAVGVLAGSIVPGFGPFTRNRLLKA